MDFQKILKVMALVAKHAAPIREVAKAGKPLMGAIQENAPELKAAIAELAAAAFPADVAKEAADVAPDAHEKAIAKAIFAPHAVTQAEKSWMDRASNPDAGGGV